MDSLKATFEKTIEAYAKKGLNGVSYLTKSADNHLYTVISIAELNGKRFINTGIVAQLLDHSIVIEHDNNSLPLVDALLEAGISRDQIVLAYEGE